MTLEDALNMHTGLVIKTVFQIYKEGPYLAASLIRHDGRAFAGGKVVLKERLEALLSGDPERVQAWGENYFNLADACIVFEDAVKLQPDSPLITGLRGFFGTVDGDFVAIDAKVFEAALIEGGMRYFNVSDSETVTNGLWKKEEVQDVVVLPYDPASVKFTPDQFKAIKADEIKRKDMIYNKHMEIKEVVRDGCVMHPAWQIYPAEIIAPLVREVFHFNTMVHNYNVNMGIFLPEEPSDEAEMRTLFVGGLEDRSGLHDIPITSRGPMLGVYDKSAQRR